MWTNKSIYNTYAGLRESKKGKEGKERCAECLWNKEQNGQPCRGRCVVWPSLPPPPKKKRHRSGKWERHVPSSSVAAVMTWLGGPAPTLLTLTTLIWYSVLGLRPGEVIMEFYKLYSLLIIYSREKCEFNPLVPTRRCPQKNPQTNSNWHLLA